MFVSVVDPGVGSTRRSIVVKTKGGQYIVSPDNGTLTHVKRIIGLDGARVIDESVNRLPNSGESYTFHGRDIYAYTGAKLAAGVISFEEVGPEVDVDSVIELPIVEPVYDGEKVSGTIDVLDVRFGSLWTNISRELFKKLGVGHGGRVEISIENETRTLYKNILVYAKSFADVYVGEPLVYVNSLDCMAVAINQEVLRVLIISVPERTGGSRSAKRRRLFTKIRKGTRWSENVPRKIKNSFWHI